MKNCSLILFIIGLAAVFYLSLVPEPPQIPVKISGIDKLEHFVAYLVLSFLLMNYLNGTRMRRVVALAAGISALAVIGALIEVLQSYTGRTPEAADFLADLAGAACGSFLSLFLKR
ncbi:MAG: VanZ family protein [Spirochaetales bacterium]|nr:VanZ family protein [Spirochaetales bacterium]